MEIIEIQGKENKNKILNQNNRKEINWFRFHFFAYFSAIT
jgi:hypothetical protein